MRCRCSVCTGRSKEVRWEQWHAVPFVAQTYKPLLPPAACLPWIRSFGSLHRERDRVLSKRCVGSFVYVTVTWVLIIKSFCPRAAPFLMRALLFQLPCAALLCQRLCGLLLKVHIHPLRPSSGRELADRTTERLLCDRSEAVSAPMGEK